MPKSGCRLRDFRQKNDDLYGGVRGGNSICSIRIRIAMIGGIAQMAAIIGLTAAGGMT